MDISKYVVEIIDHHDDKDFDYKIYPNLVFKDVRYPRSSAICLVLEELFSKDVYKEIIPKMLTHDNFYDMILAPILLDTSDFKADIKNSKWVDEDLELATHVLKECHNSIFFDEEEAKIYSDKKAEDAKYFNFTFGILNDAKYDEPKNLNLGVEALMNKDRKNFKVLHPEGKGMENQEINFMMSSLPVDINKIKAAYKDDLIRYFNSVCQDEKIDFIIFGCLIDKLHTEGFFFYNNGHYSNNGKIDEKKIEYLLNHIISEVKKDDLKMFTTQDEFYLLQSHHQINRKLIQPAVEHVLKL